MHAFLRLWSSNLKIFFMDFEFYVDQLSRKDVQVVSTSFIVLVLQND